MSNTSEAMPMSNAERIDQGGVVLGPRADRSPRQAIDRRARDSCSRPDRVRRSSSRGRRSSAAPCRRRGPHAAGRRASARGSSRRSACSNRRRASSRRSRWRRRRAAARTPARRAPSSRRIPPAPRPTIVNSRALRRTVWPSTAAWRQPGLSGELVSDDDDALVALGPLLVGAELASGGEAHIEGGEVAARDDGRERPSRRVPV